MSHFVDKRTEMNLNSIVKNFCLYQNNTSANELKSMHASHIGEESIPKLKSVLSSKVAELTELSVTNSKLLSLDEFAINAPNLTTCNFSGLIVPSALYVLLCRSSKQVRSMKLSWCANITDDAVIALVENAPYLQHLDLKRCTNLTDAAVLRVAEHCPELVSISLSDCADFAEHTLETLIRKCPKITDLNSDGAVGGHNRFNFTDNTAILIAECLPNIEKLDISHCTRITEAGWDALCACKSLTSLKMNYHSNLPIATCEKIANSFPLLQTFEYYHSVISRFDVFCRRFSAITLLDIGERKIQGSLAPLTVTEVNGDESNTSAHDDVLTGLLVRCKGTLRTLSVAPTVYKTDGSVEHNVAELLGFTELCADTLTSLNLSGISRHLSDDHLVRLSECVLCLTTVVLHDCRQLTDTAVRTLVAANPQLTSITLSSCFKLTEESLFAITEHCARVTELVLTSSNGCITDRAIVTIAQAYPSLTTLDVNWCASFSETALDYVIAHCGGIQTIRFDASDAYRESEPNLRDQYHSF